VRRRELHVDLPVDSGRQLLGNRVSRMERQPAAAADLGRRQSHQHRVGADRMRRLLRRLREARGQTLVFFVVLMGGLVLLLAFVLNVGAVASTQRQVQSLADGAALTGVQQLPFDSFQAQTDAKRYESCPSDCQISVESSGLSGGPVDTVSVQASRSVSGLLLPLVTTPTAKATASARI